MYGGWKSKKVLYINFFLRTSPPPLWFWHSIYTINRYLVYKNWANLNTECLCNWETIRKKNNSYLEFCWFNPPILYDSVPHPLAREMTLKCKKEALEGLVPSNPDCDLTNGLHLVGINTSRGMQAWLLVFPWLWRKDREEVTGTLTRWQWWRTCNHLV